jgi:hypothetical protein
MKLYPTFSTSTKIRARMLGYGTLLGIVAGVALTIYSYPTYEKVSAYIVNLGTVETTNAYAYTATSTEEDQTTLLERYTEEAFEANLATYQDDAKMKAIERIQAELEAEKEALRETALFE